LISLFRNQQYSDAIKSAQKFVQKWPNYGLGWNVIAASFNAIGKFPEAAEAFSRAVKIEPENYESLNNLGNVLRELGKFDESSATLKKAIALNPQFFQAHYNLGMVYGVLEQFENAEQSFLAAIKIKPDFADAYNYLGNIYKTQNRLQQAVEAYGKALNAMPNYAEVHNNLGNTQLSLGKLDEAEQSFNRALKLVPGSPDFLGNLGALYLRQGRLSQAENCYRQAIQEQPEMVQNHNNLGIVLQHQGKFIEAESEYRVVLKKNPNSQSVLHNYGNLALDLNQLDKGRGLHEKVVELYPDSAAAHRNLGVTQAILGNSDSAALSYRNALRIDSDEAETHYRLSEVKQFINEDPDLSLIESLLNNNSSDSTSRSYLHYAAGKAYADIGGQVDKSFEHYAKGAAAKRSMINYDAEADENLFRSIQETFTPEYIQQISTRGFECDAPVFVLGMPRSGTTLVEHILASHKDVHGAGERFDVQRLVKRTDKLKGNQFPNWVSRFNQNDYTQLGSQYWQGLKQSSDSAVRIIDKMPNNFRYAGFIAGMLAGAKVIHVKRNPLDTCVSCFTHLFEEIQDYSYDLNELGKYYRGYSGLMNHWRKALPESFFMEVQYEDIVTSPEDTVRKMLDHIELEWDSNCLNFYETQRVVPTASLVQVRQPLYKSAMGRWQAWSQHLGPLIDGLGDLADEAR